MCAQVFTDCDNTLDKDFVRALERLAQLKENVGKDILIFTHREGFYDLERLLGLSATKPPYASVNRYVCSWRETNCASGAADIKWRLEARDITRQKAGSRPLQMEKKVPKTKSEYLQGKSVDKFVTHNVKLQSSLETTITERRSLHEWTCEACTFQNIATTGACSICDLIRPLPRSKGPSCVFPLFGTRRAVLAVIDAPDPSTAAAQAVVAVECGARGVFLVARARGHAETLVRAVRARLPHAWLGLTLQHTQNDPRQAFAEMNSFQTTEANPNCLEVNGLWTEWGWINVGSDPDRDSIRFATQVAVARAASGWQGAYFAGVANELNPILGMERWTEADFTNGGDVGALFCECLVTSCWTKRPGVVAALAAGASPTSVAVACSLAEATEAMRTSRLSAVGVFLVSGAWDVTDDASRLRELVASVV